MSPTQQHSVHKKPPPLTSRQKEIIQLLARSTASHPATAGALSEMLGISTRTILREMHQIEQWLEQNDFQLIRRPGVGLFLDESVENRRLIMELLEVETVRKEYSKEERRRRILGELLYAEEPMKSYSFLSKFHISEGTLSSDLDAAAAWLNKYRVTLVRRPGSGILLEGGENERRQAIAAIVYESMDESQIMQLLRGDASERTGLMAVPERIFSLMDQQTADAVGEILQESEQKLHVRYTDSAYVGLLVHISLAIKRIHNNENMEMEPEELRRLMLMPEFSIAEKIGDRLRERFSIPIPRCEIGYITMHLSSARIWPTEGASGRRIDRVRLRQLAREMIEQVQDVLEMDFSGSSSLTEDLCSHMAPMLSRLALGIPIENPQLESIREEYPEILQATAQACDTLCRQLGTEQMPESEIAFLAMHFGAAVEQKRQAEQMVSVMVVCPTGVGTSRILAAGLTRDFPQIEVHGTLSAFRIDTKELERQGVDLIISTVQLSLDFPWVCVSPILQVQDKRRLEDTLTSLRTKQPSKRTKQDRRRMAREDIALASDMGEQLLFLLDHIRLETVYAAHTRSEVIAHAGALFAKSDRMAAELEGGLYERDQTADTYIKQLRALLLHCKTHAVTRPRFGYLKLEPPVYENGKVILGAVVMLVPEAEDDTAEQLMGAVSALLVENHTLLDRLRDGDLPASRDALEAGLGVYYKQFLKKRIGVAET